jgi:hypothetical protein
VVVWDLLVVVVLGVVECLVTVVAVVPGSGRRSVFYRLPDGTDIIYSDFLFLQMDLPEGLIHLIEMTPIGEDGAAFQVRERHLLLSVTEGRAIEIPRPAFTQPGGPGSHG